MATKTVAIVHTDPKICIELLSGVSEMNKFSIDMNDPNSVNKGKDRIRSG